MRVQPFRGLRPRADLAAKIASKPYDVLNSQEARELAAGDPHLEGLLAEAVAILHGWLMLTRTNGRGQVLHFNIVPRRRSRC